MGIKIYNTLSGRKEDFRPLDGNKVRMYVCGITAYDDCHLGHARAYTAFDMICRYLFFSGYEVKYVRNVTDIDDKIINKTRELYAGEHDSDEMKALCRDISRKYYDSFAEDTGRLQLLPPQAEPRATEHIGEMLEIIKKLVEREYAYVKDGDVFFRVEKNKDYGKLSKRELEQMTAGARVEEDGRKENPFDFALWKSSKPGEPAWGSPWGKGRPGWHIECSAMSLKHLGETIDIHGGGQDLIFPHHENEIVQSESYTGKPFVRYWIHNGFITINREKMSKSLKNFTTLKELFQKYPPRAIKFYLLSTHYRSPLDFSDSLITASFSGLKRIENALMQAAGEVPDNERASKGTEESIMKKFREDMDDDFNSAKAIGMIFDTVTEILSLLESKEKDRKRLWLLRNTVAGMMDVLGVIYETKAVSRVAHTEAAKASLEEAEKIMAGEDPDENDIAVLLGSRMEMKKKKQFQKADAIRDFLISKGIELRDVKDGTEWSRNI